MPEGSQTLLPPTRPLLTKKCTIVIVDIGFRRDLGCDVKFDNKSEKYSPLIAALGRYWERVEFIAFPIGHAGPTLSKTLDHLTAAFSTVRPTMKRSRANRGASSPATDHNAKTHDYLLDITAHTGTRRIPIVSLPYRF